MAASVAPPEAASQSQTAGREALTIGALALVSPWAVLPLLVIVPPIGAVCRWYMRRAPEGYLAESARRADLTDGLAETVDGARTVEALGLQQHRIRRTDEDIRRQ